MKRIYINTILACSFVACALTACTDVWDEHYQTDSTLSGDDNLWELISSNPELTEFAALLEATGYDTLLSMNRSYTVWAPTQMPDDVNLASLESASDSLLGVYRKEIVENHIANYSHVAGGIRDKEDMKNYKKVEMLIKKSYDFVGSTNGSYKFAGNGLRSTNVVAKNGVLHVLDGYTTFASNIWEQLAKEKRVNKLFSFLNKDYKRDFNPAASTPGPIVDGKPTYLDSVFTESCRWFYELGQINKEDSSYTMYALTDKAWDELVEKTKAYYVYQPGLTTLSDYGNLSSEALTDSLAKEFSCRNLVFSNTVNKRYFEGATDTLKSNYPSYPRQLFIGNEADSLSHGSVHEYESLSNGSLYVVDAVNYNPFTCWFDTLRVEGENLWYQTSEAVDVALNAYASSKGIDKDSIIYDQISRGAVGVFTPKELHDLPVLSFYVDDVLSSYYRVSVVILPPHIINPADTAFIKPNKFDARLYFADGTNSGSLALRGLENRKAHPSVQEIEYKKPNGDVESVDIAFVSDVNKIDTIVLADCIRIPYSEYRLKSLTGNVRKTRLELTTTIKASTSNLAGPPALRYDNIGNKFDATGQPKWKYDNSYRIDQVIFEPIEAPQGE